MPLHMVAEDIAAGRLKQIVIESWGKPSFAVPHYLVLRRGREPGRAVCWLIRHLQQRFAKPEPAQPDAVRQSADPLPGQPDRKRVSAR